MKTLSFFTGSALVRALFVSVLFSFGSQVRLFAPPSLPQPTYYPADGDFGLGTDISLTPVSGDEDITDYDIMTPDGDLTPSNSEITSSQDFPVSSFFDVFVEISGPDIGITIQGTNGSVNGQTWQIEMGENGSITGPGGLLVSDGRWSLPDHSQTWMLLLLGVGLLRLGRGTRRFAMGR